MKSLWQPDKQTIETSNMRVYMLWLKEHYGLAFEDYHQLWAWSVTETERFWESIVQFFNINISYSHVYRGHMPQVSWFEGATLNYVSYIFRQKTEAYPAIIFKEEDQDFEYISWEKLENDVACLAHYFREKGLKQNDVVVGILTNRPETIVAFLATLAVGAIWACVSPEFGNEAILDRFSALHPSILIAETGYQYGGKKFDKTKEIEAIQQALPSITLTILLGGSENAIKNTKPTQVWENIPFEKPQKLICKPLAFDHPIFIVFSSGTTGKPKAIVHRQGGIMLTLMVSHVLHQNIKPGERYYWHSTTGWIMWNIAQASLLAGATLVLYNGSPVYPKPDALWAFAAEAELSHFGLGAAFILSSMQAGLSPKSHNLAHLKTIGSTGSPLPAEGFEWVYNHVKKDLVLMSLSGGTELCSGVVGGCVLLPVVAGEIQCRMLGCAVEAWNEEGQPVIDEMGEMVLVKPLPSMPIYFWNDSDFVKYKSSYFEEYEGIWRHGDWLKITSRGSVVIYGRSDATLNKNGIRIGTSEIYRVVEQIEAVQDSLILNIEYPDGSSWMPLFVKLGQSQKPTEALFDKIKAELRQKCSARHVPDEIIVVNDIAYTLSNKKIEVPIKKIFLGQNPEKVVNYGSLRNPEAISEYLKIYQEKIHLKK